jgi:NAD(P)-dependent dehydrogenase (short-subunit alcohol dehydrogenase family)
MENLKGKTAFITGGASGIGFGIAKACAKEGMNVVIVDMRQSAIGEAVEYFNKNNWPVLGLQLDVTDRVAYPLVVDKAEEKFGNIHLLVNNAGIGCKGGPIWEVSHEETDLGLSVNLTAVFNGVQTIVPRMLKHGEGGHVVSTASKAAILPCPGTGLYNVTKAAVFCMMEQLAEDLAGTTVGASAFCPGGYITNLGISSNEVTAKLLGNAPPPPPARGPQEDADWNEILRSPDDAGERVVRGVKRGDLYILTHAEFKEGVESRLNAILRAFPEETPNPRYREVFPFLVYNDVFDKQTQVPALNKS